MIDALIIKWFFRLTHRFRFSNYNSNLFKSIEALNRFSAHQFYTPLFTYPTFRKKKNGNDENKTLFTYSYTSLDWTKSYTFFVRTFSIILIIITYFIISTRKSNIEISSLPDLFNFRIETNTRVFYHLERWTKYLARCARRGTIKIVTYYEASEKDLNYACHLRWD